MNESLFLPSAEADLFRILDFYDARSPGLGLEVNEDIKATVEKIADRRRVYAVVYRGRIRKVMTQRFPIAVLYEVDGELVIVHRIFHARSDYQKNVF